MVFTLNHLHVVSRAITVSGIILLIAGLALGAQPILTLIGGMLIIAGVVKMTMMWIWTHLAKMGTDEHHPEQVA